MNTVYDVHLKYRAGDHLHPTIYLTTSTMKVFLTDDHGDDVRRLLDLQNRAYRLG